MHTCRHTQQYLDVGVGFQWSEFHTFLFLFSPCNLFSLYTQTCLMTTIPLLFPVCFLSLSTRRISWSVQCSKFISGANISNFFRCILHFVGWWISLSCSVSELSFDSETFSCSHLRSLPGDSADAVALVEQRLVGRREQRVFKQMSILLTLSPQSRERLTLIRNRHHPAHTNTDRCGYGGKSLNHPQCVFCIYKNIKRLLL